MEFFGPEEEGFVVHHVHEAPAFFPGNAAERRALNFPCVLKFTEEGLHGLEVAYHGVVPAALFQWPMPPSLGVQLRVRRRVEVFFGHKLPKAHKEVHIEGFGADSQDVVYDKEAVQFPSLAFHLPIPARAHDPVPVRFLDVTEQALVEGFVTARELQFPVFHHTPDLRLKVPVVQLQMPNLHEGVGLAHGKDVSVQLGFEQFV